MNELLHRVVWDNEVGDYIWVGGVIAVILLLHRYISKYIALLLCKLLKRVWKAFDQQKFIELIIQPLGLFLSVAVSIIALYRLRFPSAINITIYKFPLQAVFLAVGISVQIIFFTWLLLRTIDFIANVLERRALEAHDRNDNQLIVFFRDFLKVIIAIIGGMLLLHFAFNYDISSLLTGLSIVGAAIALALRESLENLIASFVIFFDKPFTLGDTVKVQGITGLVEKIGLRSTRIRSDQKTYITVPNKQMVDTILDNQSLRTQQKAELQLQVSLNTSAADMEALMTELRNFLSGVNEVDGFNVWFIDIGIQSCNIMIEYFIPAAHLPGFNNIRQRINLYALQKLEAMQIKIAGTGKEVLIK